MKVKFISRLFVIALVCIFSSANIAFSQSNQVSDGSTSSAPECWAGDTIEYSQRIVKNPNLVEQRVSTYEIHDDDSVNPNHMVTGMAYYSSLTWQGSLDAQWLVLEGQFSSYTIDPVNHSVTFYDLQNWLHVVYRTNNFIQRTPDQIRFCVIGQNGGIYRDTQVKVTYPANYLFLSATPPSYSIPAPGEIDWSFGSIDQFQVDTYFGGLGPDRPLLDLPVYYEGRDTGNADGFRAAFSNRTTSKFDHAYPYYTHNFDCVKDPPSGIQHDNILTDSTGNRLGPPANVCDCVLKHTCYDGHDGYDIDDLCPSNGYPCGNNSKVFAAADGKVITPTGWNATLGCRITIDHGNNWTTSYNHLLDTNNNKGCDGILVKVGDPVFRTTQLGIIGNSGSGSKGSHLHFMVKHNGITVDPSGWEPNPQVYPDPWSLNPNGEPSYPMWLYSLRSSQVFDPNIGGEFASPTHDIIASIPIGYYSEPLLFNLSTQSVPDPMATYFGTGHSFSLTASDGQGNFIQELNNNITLATKFTTEDIRGINPNTLSLYYWDEATNSWITIPTSIDWGTMTAYAQVNHLSVFAFFGMAENLIYLPSITR